MVGTKRAARAEKCFSLSFPSPSLFLPFSLFKNPSGHGYVHVYVHVHVNV